MNGFRLLVLLILILLPARSKCQNYVFDFQTDYQGWSGDFADYPVTDSVFYELAFKRTNLPAPLDTGRYALMITGSNHSDDLFMFIKRKITGLTPNKIYRLLIDIELASEAPTNAVGIGGAPGESVFLKAGATMAEPRKIDTEGFYLMNIDKSNQAAPGADMDTIGHIGVSDTTTVFSLISRSNAGRLFTITTDDRGAVWVCIGTDSGFEGVTTLYYSRISLTFDNMTGKEERFMDIPDETILFPNPVKSYLYIQSKGPKIKTVELFYPDGKLAGIEQNSDRISVKNKKPGTYLVRVTFENNRMVNRKVIIQ